LPREFDGGNRLPVKPLYPSPAHGQADLASVAGSPAIGLSLPSPGLHLRTVFLSEKEVLMIALRAVQFFLTPPRRACVRNPIRNLHISAGPCRSLRVRRSLKGPPRPQTIPFGRLPEASLLRSSCAYGSPETLSRFAWTLPINERFLVHALVPVSLSSALVSVGVPSRHPYLRVEHLKHKTQRTSPLLFLPQWMVPRRQLRRGQNFADHKPSFLLLPSPRGQSPIDKGIGCCDVLSYLSPFYLQSLGNEVQVGIKSQDQLVSKVLVFTFLPIVHLRIGPVYGPP